MNLLKTSFFVLATAFLQTSLAQQLLTWTDVHGRTKAVKTNREWRKKRSAILDSMQAVMGALYVDPRMTLFNYRMTSLPEMDVQYIDSLSTNTYTRYTISFTPAKTETVVAYLYIPQKKTVRKFPAILALHPTGESGKQIVDGQGPRENRAYAKELAARGYVVIAPDYPGFGDQKAYDFSLDRYSSGTMKAVFDNIRCLDLLQTRGDVDPGRIGVIGHSLGGHNAIFTAAFDQRIKAVVSSCGWTLLNYYYAGKAVTEKYGGTLGPWAQELYMPLLREKYDLDTAKIPFDFDEVIATIAPRGFFSNSPKADGNFNVEGVRVGMDRILAVYKWWNAKENLEVVYPQATHDFPPEIRRQAYEFLDKHLK